MEMVSGNEALLSRLFVLFIFSEVIILAVLSANVLSNRAISAACKILSHFSMIVFDLVFLWLFVDHDIDNARDYCECSHRQRPICTARP